MAEKTWRRVDHVVSTPVEGGLALMDLDRGVYFTFNATSAAIWNMLEHPCTPAMIEHGLRAEFDVEAEQCALAVVDVLRKFAAEALVEEIAGAGR